MNCLYILHNLHFMMCSVPPYIDDASIDRNIRIIKGRQLILNCPAMGTPYPSISWYRNGFPVSVT